MVFVYVRVSVELEMDLVEVVVEVQKFQYEEDLGTFDNQVEMYKGVNNEEHEENKEEYSME